MNYNQTFAEFSKSINGTDLALYAGIGIVLWILFQDHLNPVKQFFIKTLNTFNLKSKNNPLLTTPVSNVVTNENQEDIFFQLVASWKLTRDLAVRNGCSEAVKVADQMFPFLSPNICNNKE